MMSFGGKMELTEEEVKDVCVCFVFCCVCDILQNSPQVKQPSRRTIVSPTTRSTLSLLLFRRILSEKNSSSKMYEVGRLQSLVSHQI